MLMVAKNQLKVSLLAIKYALIKEMLNKATFFTNVIFMILNNSSMIIQWLVLYSLKDNIGGYSFKELLLLWGISATAYGISRGFFFSAFKLSDTIVNGKLDAFLIQPKSVLLNVITTDASSGAIGDIIFGYIMVFIYGFSIKTFLMFTLFAIIGGILLTAIAIILGSLSFWLKNSSIIADSGNDMMVHFGSYPDGIFKGAVKALLFTLVPVGIAYYLPIRIIINFNLVFLGIVIGVTGLITFLAVIIFNRGLKRYSSSNLMISRI